MKAIDRPISVISSLSFNEQLLLFKFTIMKLLPTIGLFVVAILIHGSFAHHETHDGNFVILQTNVCCLKKSLQ